MKKTGYILGTAGMLAMPMLAAAQPATTYGGLVSDIIGIINILIPSLFAVLFVYLIWKMVDAWVLHAGDQTKREEGRKYATAAVIVFVLMISAWGIVAILRQSIF